jgi:hypothetical protein
MIPQYKVQRSHESLKPGKDTVITFDVMIDHISQMEYGIQGKGIEYLNAAVKFGK